MVGDIVTLWSRPLHVGRTSIRIQVKVLARARRTPDDNEVTTAEVTMVAVDETGSRIPVLGDSRAGDGHDGPGFSGR